MDLADLVSAGAMKLLLRFLGLGALLFAGKLILADARGGDPIAVSAADVRRLYATWTAEMKRAPDTTELAALVRRHADEETLLREALRLGLDRSDPVVRTRLLQNMRFVHADPAADEADLLAQAYALGMARRDVVARRRLVQAMEERFAAGVSISQSDLTGYLATHVLRYGAPERVAFRHVFVSADRHGSRLDEVARGVGTRLAAGEAIAGDPFLLGSRFDAAAGEIARTFGAGFAQSITAAPRGRWSGPITSAYGLHFVRVDGTTPAAPPDAAARRQAYYALLQEREEQAVHEALARLRPRYPVTVDDGVTLAMVRP